MGFFQERNRLLETAGVFVVHAQVRHGQQRFRVVSPVFRLLQLQELLEQWDRFVELAQSPVGHAELVHGFERVGMVTVQVGPSCHPRLQRGAAQPVPAFRLSDAPQLRFDLSASKSASVSFGAFSGIATVGFSAALLGVATGAFSAAFFKSASTSAHN